MILIMTNSGETGTSNVLDSGNTVINKTDGVLGQTVLLECKIQKDLTECCYSRRADFDS